MKLLSSDNLNSRILLIFVVILLSAILSGCQSAEVKPVIKAVDGVLDLTHWDFATDGNVYLNGRWEFYWQELLTPEDFINGDKSLFSRMFMDIPSSWNSYKIDGQELGGEGYATFRLRVLLPDGESLKAIKVPSISTAHKLWVNGEMLSSQGTVSSNSEQAVPKYYPQVIDLKQQKGELELVLQVSNFDHRRGGVWQPFVLGNKDQIRSARDSKIISDMILFGGLLVIGIYHYILCFMFYAGMTNRLCISAFSVYWQALESF